ncbi:MAG: SpaA isopeptide-forming pilin-related protein [Chthoniobacterales bacterium]
MNRFHLLLVLLTNLAALPCAAWAAGEPNAAGETGLEGVISISPAHGGPIRADEPSSKPLSGVAFVVMKGQETVASFQTDAEGHFQVALPPGHYTVQRAEAQSSIGRSGPFEADVAQGKLTHVQWQSDSGMR